MTQLDRTTPVVGNVPSPRRPLEPWTPTPPSGIRWLDAGPPAPPTPARSRRRVGWVLGLVALLGVLAAAAVLLVPERTMSVQGSVTVAVRSATLPGAPCSAPPVSGRTMTIFDSAGTQVASTRVPRSGYAVDRWGTGSPFADACRLDVLFTDVPATDTVYRVGVGGSLADSVGFSREVLETAGAAITYGR